MSLNKVNESSPSKNLLKKSSELEQNKEDASKKKISEKQLEIPELFRTQVLFDKTLKNEIQLESIINSKVIGLFFSASWCGPSQEFLISLKRGYEEIKEKYSNFEIIFVSSDDTQSLCNYNFVNNHGNWLLWPFDSNLVQSLRSFYQIEYLPKLIIIKPDFEVLSVTGRKDLNERGASIAFTNWAYLWNKSKLVIDKK